jgi:hypothetical protein
MKRACAETPELVSLDSDEAAPLTDIHVGRLRGHKLADQHARLPRACYFNIDGQSARPEGQHPALPAAANQRRIIVVYQRIKDQLSQIGVYRAPRESAHRSIEQRGRHRVDLRYDPSQLIFQIGMVGFVRH